MTSNRPAAPILLVEDDQLLRQALRILLEDAGYRVSEASSAAEAEACIASEKPALVLLDLGLPDRPGLDIARAVRRARRTADVPVVALTGRAGPKEQLACLEAGCTIYFCKPVEPAELIACLFELIGHAGR